MPKVPVISGKKALRVFRKAGFVEKHVNGSHHILAKDGIGILTVPVHGKNDIPKGTLRALITQAEMTVQEFIDLS